MSGRNYLINAFYALKRIEPKQQRSHDLPQKQLCVILSTSWKQAEFNLLSISIICGKKSLALFAVTELSDAAHH